MLKKAAFLLVLVVMIESSIGQIIMPQQYATPAQISAFMENGKQTDPVQFKHRLRKIDKHTYQLSIIAYIKPSWHIYSKDQPEGSVCQPTCIAFSTSPLVVPMTDMREVGNKISQQSDYGIKQFYYEDSVEFTQTIRTFYWWNCWHDPKLCDITIPLTVSISYQACTDWLCLPPRIIEFELKLDQSLIVKNQ